MTTRAHEPWHPRTDGRVRWSVAAVRVPDGTALPTPPGSAVLRTASVGKLLLLTEVARRFGDGTLDPSRPVRRADSPPVADSGLWHLLDEPVLTVADLAVLVAAVSDNWATNALWQWCDPGRVRDVARGQGVTSPVLADRVRDRRGPDDPPTLSVGSADDWAEILFRIARGAWVDGQVSARLRHWLGLNTDHSMVAADWALDPLVVADEQHPWLGNKTGSDVGVRADVGLVLTGPGTGTVWAAIADWDDPDPRLTREVVLDLRDFGRWLRAATG